MERLVIPPTKAVEMYKDVAAPRVCPIGWMFQFIRHDGKVELCACVADGESRWGTTSIPLRRSASFSGLATRFVSSALGTSSVTIFIWLITRVGNPGLNLTLKTMYTQHVRCRACNYGPALVPEGIKAEDNGEKLIPVFDLGLQPLANDFKSPNEEHAGFAPLKVLLCRAVHSRSCPSW